MAQGIMPRESSPAVPTPVSERRASSTFEEKLMLLHLFDHRHHQDRNSSFGDVTNHAFNTAIGSDSSYLNHNSNSSNLSLIDLSSQADCDNNAPVLESPLRSATSKSHKSMRRKRKSSTPISAGGATGITWSETIPLTAHSTKESVMGPLESFLRSIDCYVDREREEKRKEKKEPSKHAARGHQIFEKFEVPTRHLQRPPTAPPLSEASSSENAFSQTSPFSWTPSLLSTRKGTAKSNARKPTFISDVNTPEKERKDDKDEESDGSQ